MQLSKTKLLTLVISVAAGASAAGLQTTPTQSVLPTLAPDCVEWHEVRDSDTCLGVCQAHHIPIEAFLAMNPALDRQCRPLYMGYFYCVRLDHMYSG